MTIAELCVLGAVALYLLTIGWTKARALRQYDNARPRDPAFYAEPVRARGLAAHQNGMEAFPLYAAAVLLAEFRGAPQDWIDGLAGLYLLLRVGYVAAYLADRANLRSLLWAGALLANIAIFLLPLST